MTVLLSITSPSFSNTIIPIKLSNHGTKTVFANNPSRGSPIKRSSRLIIRCSADQITRHDFPPEFKFGASMSAIQSESEATAGGRGASTCDSTFTGLAGANSLEKYNEDVLCLKNMNVDVYRMSFSWCRLFPTGEVSAETVNKEAVTFYKDFINQLTLNGIEPFVTLFHFDMPLALLNKYNGALSSKFVDDFNAYADFCFEHFGDQVKHWTTVNEPHVWSSVLYKEEIIHDDDSTYPYIVAGNILKAHAAAYSTYQKKYKAIQNGKIGMSLNVQWFFPYSHSRPDKQAALRAWDFMVGWFLDPLVNGDFPFNLRAIVKDRLPQFTDEEQKAVKGAFDFIGLNYYTSSFVKALPSPHPDGKTGFNADQYLSLLEESKYGESIGELAEGNATMRVCPLGIYKILKYIKDEYHNPLIYITENGYPQSRDDNLAISKAIEDDVRINFINDHLKSVLKAKKEGVNVNGYFYWNLMDCVELTDRDTVRFGLNYTDYSNKYNRIPKKSANWLKSILARRPEHVAPKEPAAPIVATKPVAPVESATPMEKVLN